MEKIKVHIISHTHWDREWYLSFEKHHVKLVALMDNLLYLLDKNDGFESFHLDGQTIILEDYLQIRPEMKDKIVKFVKAGKLNIGPWYILQDEFLTSSEANIRNLLIGIKDARSYGGVTMIGYFPDAFGNIGQAPQILKQAGMKAAVFGRGVKPIGFDNQILEYDKYESPYSEMIWQSPDGSSILGVLFANWYNNGNEIPVEENQASVYWNERIKNTSKFAATNQHLFMNGCDHQPVQKDLSKAIETAKKLFPQMEFVHSNFNDYIDSINNKLKKELTVVKGELRSQETDGWWTLANTASARIYLKQMNQRNQAALEKVAEPLAVFAASVGFTYPHHLFTFAWKILMQNHPHDSICGCSVDEVHREMVTRFEKSMSITEELIKESISYISEKIDTADFQSINENAIPFIVYNTSGWERTGVVSVEVDLQRKYGGLLTEAYSDMELLDCKGWSLVDALGVATDCTLEDLGTCFGYDLPEDKFRQPFMARRFRVTFEAIKVPTLGYKVYALIKNKATQVKEGSLVTGDHQMENYNIKVAINADGTLNITDKRSNHTYEELCYYENVGDIGNEYIFKQAYEDSVIYTKGIPAEIKLIEDNPYRATFEITHQLEIPESADELLEIEMKKMIPFLDRKARRAQKLVQFKIVTQVSLEKSSTSVKVKTTFNNNALNHRLRVMLPSGLQSQHHFADSIFEVAKRNNAPSKTWRNPSNCQHQQAFVSIDDGECGLTIANLGLNEYEILQDDKNTIAVTVLRAVGEMGDWGVFLTPEAQCLGEHIVEFEIIPHKGDFIGSGAFIEAYQYQIPWLGSQTDIHTGVIPPEHSFIIWQGTNLAFSGLKLKDGTDELIVRWYNLALDECNLRIEPKVKTETVYLSNVVEALTSYIKPCAAGELSTIVRGAEIITLGMKMDKNF